MGKEKGYNGGRPKATIDFKKLDAMLQSGCTGTECAGFFGIHPNTLYRRVEEEYNMSFSEYSQQKKASGDAMLKIKMYESAMEKDRGMLIWLSKNRLGYADKKEVTQSGDIGLRSITIKEAQEDKGGEDGDRD